jgi:ABC-type antimicrobial peptide transport system permease subunit
VAPEARRVAGEVLGPEAVRRVTTLAEQVDEAIVPERLMALLAGFFGGAGALLAAIGLYGIIAYTVTLRTKEIGVRMALGATRADVMRMILAGAAWLVLAGFVIGAPAAFWSRRVAAAMLENLPSGGVLPIGVAIGAMIAVALVAACVPARRATRVEPVRALRSE